MTDRPLLSVRNLEKHYPITEGVLSREVGRVRAVDGVSFDIYPGETLGLVGESGCGKSTAARTVVNLEAPTGGRVIFNGGSGDPDEPGQENDVSEFDDEEMRQFDRTVQMIFQDPSASLDPRMTVGESVAEPLRIHGFGDATARRTVVEDLLDRVGLSPEDYDRFPHEFSGGEKQRISLARALVTNPKLVVADEPVSALDVSVQAEILSLINDIQAEFGLSLLVISHDMGVVREVSDRVAVMYLGEVVEVGPTEQLFADPQHPYTEALLSSIPSTDPRAPADGIELTGEVPDPSNPPGGCRFHTRCHRVIQPEGYDFDQEVWRGVMDLRARLARGGIDVAAAREFAATERDVEDPRDVPTGAVADAIRDEFDLPGTLSDPEAESVLADALAQLVAGNHDRAEAVLADAFETVCESSAPELSDTGTDHRAACHLHDRTDDVDPLRSARTDD